MFYSFVVRSTREVPIPEHLLVIGEGIDTFNAIVENLEVFRERLRLEGVQILQVHQLDEVDPLPVLPGDLPPQLGG